MAPTTLNISSRVSPTILNGSRIIQMIGKRKSAISAIGQQTINKKHQRITAIRTLIENFNTPFCKNSTSYKFAQKLAFE
jgi:hypothetical protein